MKENPVSISLWECSGEPPTWEAHPPIDNYGETCSICGRPRSGSNLAGERLSIAQPGPSSQGRWLGIGILALILLGGILGWLGLRQLGQPSQPVANQAATPPVKPTVAAAESDPANSPQRYSRGEQRLMRSTANPDGDRGAAAFAAGDYAQAQEFFRKAIQGDRGNPELQIYLNNATARRSAKPPMTIAVVVPIESGLTSAEEILRGAADAQTEFNKAGGIDGRLLELVIANDDNDPKISPGVAQTLVAKPNILGVLGHNASAASEAAVGEYEKANMAMLSPTSATSLIKSKVFFRTNFSTEVQGATLANYARNVLKLNQVAVFYNPNDPTSRGLQESFVEHFREVGGGFVVAIDLANPDFDPKEQIQSLQGKFDTIALFTNTDLTTVAISLATANYALPAAQRMRLLGSNSLYKPQTLVSGQRAVEGLTIPVAWFAQTPYAQRAEERWGGQVSWRTATSYDGTKAFIEALSDQPSRASVLRNLTQVSLPADQTSGSPLRFSGERSRIGEPILVQVVSGKGGPTGSELVFRPLN